MSEAGVNIHALDAAYKPFPTFAEWALKTSIDTVRWDRYKAALENRPDTSPETLKRAYEIVKRASALDTGAIEGLYQVDRGFTYTVAFETATWEVELAKKGENVRSLFEAQLHAYDFVLDLATKAVPISEVAIRKLHEVVCAAQDTYHVTTALGPQEQQLTKGRYKVLPNHVRTRDGADHSYAPVDMTPPEMARLVTEMRSEAFLAAHPVLQASYAHYGLVVIHPFADGNGRVARALASVFTYRAISMPIMILSDEKEEYLDSLEAADRGNCQKFVDFMLARSLDTMTLVEEGARGMLTRRPEDAAAAINRLYVTKGGYTQTQVDEAGRGLTELILTEIQVAISKVSGPNLQGQAISVTSAGHEIFAASSHRVLLRADGDLIVYTIELKSSIPASARSSRQYILWLPRDASADDMLLARVVDGRPRIVFDPNQVAFSARVEELIPGVSVALRIRVGLFADRLISEILGDLEQLVRGSLHGRPQ